MNKYFRVILLALWGFVFVVPELSAQSIEDARKIWEKNLDSKEFQDYMSEFVQYNNYHKLDERNGCYRITGGKVEIFFVIEHRESSEFATIDKAISEANSAKANCFKNSYLGVPVKPPPYLPFVFQMEFI